MRSELCAGAVSALALSVVALSAPAEAQMRVNLEPAVEGVTAPLAIAGAMDHVGRTLTPNPAFTISTIASVS